MTVTLATRGRDGMFIGMNDQIQTRLMPAHVMNADHSKTCSHYKQNGEKMIETHNPLHSSRTVDVCVEKAMYRALMSIYVENIQHRRDGATCVTA